jgi:hypothetical protein
MLVAASRNREGGTMERIDIPVLKVPVLKVIAQTKKQLRAFELGVLVRVDDTLRFATSRVRSRLRKLRTARPAPRKSARSKRSRPSLVAAAA